MHIYSSWIFCLIVNIIVAIHFILDPFAANDYTDESMGTIIHTEQSKQYDGSTEYIIYHSTIVFTDKEDVEQTVHNENKVISALIAPPYIDIEKRKEAVNLEQTKDYVGKTVLIAYNRNNPQKFKVSGLSGGDKLVYVNFTLVILEIISILFVIYDTRKKKISTKQAQPI
ncbi:hypothetical protein MTZ49_15375 [Entomomonas sp. E2T0]|uniref:hypothetical protein n=1 Tax=Entomomonas sp. E2T0 TaxID=2930213 RepID=UPI0022282012|nr:hypothetical protein [Entomomonas sp. E2T0]UYZ83951.1 hypothetical protein MTZ49_15375 [Entomomonas sp. E2T0]